MKLPPVHPNFFQERKAAAALAAFIKRNFHKIKRKESLTPEIVEYADKAVNDFSNFHSKEFLRLLKEHKNKNGFYVFEKITISSQALNFVPRETFEDLKNATITRVTAAVDDLRKKIAEETAKAALTGISVGDLNKLILQGLQVSERKAQLIGAANVRMYNMILTQIKHENLGIKKGIWTTAHDERVRQTHKMRDGVKYDLKKGCKVKGDPRFIFPSISDYGCRCVYKAILPK